MRVAYLTHFIPHYRKEIFINLTKNLRGEFYVYASSKPKLAFSLLDNNTPNIIFIESEINSIKLFKKNVYFQTDILKKLLINEFDIYMLSLNPSDLTIWLALIFAKIFKRKIILWGHGYKPYQRNTYSLIRKMMVRLSTASIFYSKSAVDYYIKFIKPEKLYYSNNAVNTQEIIEIKKNISYEKLKGIHKTCTTPGRGMLIPFLILTELNYFDEKFEQYHSDSDFCLRAIEAGFSVYVNWDAIIFSCYKNTSVSSSYI